MSLIFPTAVTRQGDGLQQAIAGQPATIRMTCFDQFGNRATPGDAWRVHLSLVEDRAKKRVNELVAYSDCSGRWDTSIEGVYEMTYVAKRAGVVDLYLWSQSRVMQAGATTGTGAAAAATGGGGGATEHGQQSLGPIVGLPASPYSIHVSAGPATALHSYCEPLAVTKGLLAKGVNKASAAAASKREDVADTAAADVTAGDVVSVRANGVDQFQNPALLHENRIHASVLLPSGALAEMDMLSASAARRGAAGKKEADVPGCSAMYELRYETVMSGKHTIHVRLDGESLRNAPVTFEVHPSAPAHGVLELPDAVDCLPADLGTPAHVLLRTFDKFDNACVSGGLRVAGRLVLVKQPVGDNSILMPNNHTVEIRDRDDGTYEVHCRALEPVPRLRSSRALIADATIEADCA